MLSLLIKKRILVMLMIHDDTLLKKKKIDLKCLNECRNKLFLFILIYRMKHYTIYQTITISSKHS